MLLGHGGSALINDVVLVVRNNFGIFQILKIRECESGWIRSLIGDKVRKILKAHGRRSDTIFSFVVIGIVI